MLPGWDAFDQLAAGVVPAQRSQILVVEPAVRQLQTNAGITHRVTADRDDAQPKRRLR